MNLDDLLAAIRAAPDLPGARCVGHAKLFDSDAADDVAAATGICKYSCPALTACKTWLASLPASQRPLGVVAGAVQHRVRPRHKPVPVSRRTELATADHEAVMARGGAVKAAGGRKHAHRQRHSRTQHEPPDLQR